MEAKDFMLGNWVCFECQKLNLKDIGRIAAINPREGAVEPKTFDIWFEKDGKTGLYVGCSIRHIKPIPLTAEILELNGFERHELGDGEVIMWTGYGPDGEDDLEVEFRKDGLIRIKFDVEGHYYCTDAIKYVHKFQNALRICEIDKEIVLRED